MGPRLCDPSSWLPLAVGHELTQPRTHFSPISVISICYILPTCFSSDDATGTVRFPPQRIAAVTDEQENVNYILPDYFTFVGIGSFEMSLAIINSVFMIHLKYPFIHGNLTKSRTYSRLRHQHHGLNMISPSWTAVLKREIMVRWMNMIP